MRATRLVESACRQTYTRFFRHSAGVMDETAPVFTTNDSLPGTFVHEEGLAQAEDVGRALFAEVKD